MISAQRARQGGRAPRIIGVLSVRDGIQAVTVATSSSMRLKQFLFAVRKHRSGPFA
jgi:hypothetical protein